MSEAIEGHGTLVEIGQGTTPESYDPVSEVVSFTGPGGSAAVIDVTHLQSSAKEKMMGLFDEGQVSLELNLVPSNTGQTRLRADRVAKTKRNFRVTLTDTPATVLTFAAYVINFSIGTGVDDKATASVTLEVTGDVTWA